MEGLRSVAKFPPVQPGKMIVESRFVRRISEAGSLLFSTVIFFSVSFYSPLVFASASSAQDSGKNIETKKTPADHFFIREFRVTGGRKLPQLEIEKTVYPFLGPYRTDDDIEQARAALEKAYRDKGYQAAFVQVADSPRKNGVIILQVMEGKIGRVRVNGARYFSPSQIKEEAPSLAQGKVLDYNDFTRDIVALNQLPDRRVTPAPHLGREPGQVDIDLNVEDTFPLHGNLEINNRYSANTTELRVNGGVSYNNLWQIGHAAGFNFQVSPENLEEVKVFSGYYSARVPEWDWLNLTLQGVKQDSNVSTLGGLAVAGRGETIGPRASFTLPGGKDFFHSVTLGMDYKHYDQTSAGSTTPVTYYPFNAAYGATWLGKGWGTEFNSSVTAHVRGLGSSPSEFDAKRFKADSGFVYLRSDISHTHDLPADWQYYVKAQGQVADRPLLDSEEFSGGGLGTARGYLESEATGDNAVFGTMELRTPSLTPLIGKKLNEWRFYAFTDAGILTIYDALPEQKSDFELASVGVGSRIKLEDHFNGSLDVGVPLLDGPNRSAYDPLLTFRVWCDF